MSQSQKKLTSKKKTSGIKSRPATKEVSTDKYHDKVKVPGTFEQIFKKAIRKD